MNARRFNQLYKVVHCLYAHRNQCLMAGRLLKRLGLRGILNVAALWK